MLKYIWTVTEDLLLTVTLISLMFALMDRLYGRRGRTAQWIGIGVGLAASVALAVVKNTSNKIISSHWNHYTWGVILGFMLAFLVLSLVFGRKDHPKWNAGAALLCVAGAGLTAAMLFYATPPVIAYPKNFHTAGNGVYSVEFLVRLIGWALALILLAVYSRFLYKGAMRMKKHGPVLAALDGGILAYSVFCFGYFFSPWITRAKWLGWPIKYNMKDPLHYAIRNLTMFVSTHSMLFTWIGAGLAVALVIGLFVENLRVTEPYDNPAQLRRHRANHRKNRRYAAVVLVCFAIAVVNMTVIYAYDNREIELSAPETYTVAEGKIIVPLSQVEDGHLHRFEYKTAKNVDVRWIVIKKPGSAAYGVGLDACDVCGNAGYFERSGQVVCKRCDVVMNITTIGFKGGCNPIPLEHGYSIESGNMVFELSDILSGESQFSR